MTRNTAVVEDDAPPLEDEDDDVELCETCKVNADDCECWCCNNCGEDQLIKTPECEHCGECPTCCQCVAVDCSCGKVTEDQVCSACSYCMDCHSCNYCESCCEYIAEDEGFCFDCYHCNSCGCTEDDDDGGSENKRGKSDKPGWELRGITITTTEIQTTRPPGTYREIWAIDNHRLDLCQAMADFYMLDFVAGNCRLLGVQRGLLHSKIGLIVGEAKTRQAELVADLDRNFRAYMDMAIGGELRYHKAIGGRVITKDSRTEAWVHWKVLRDRLGVEALIEAARLAREVGGGGILGEAWAKAADVLIMRLTGKIDPHTFVDRAFTLQHNGGILFNKIPWAVRNRMAWDLTNVLHIIGPSQAHNPTLWGNLLMVASPEVSRLFHRYWRESNRVRMRAGLGIDAPPNEKDHITDDGRSVVTLTDDKGRPMGMWGLPVRYGMVIEFEQLFGQYIDSADYDWALLTTPIPRWVLTSYPHSEATNCEKCSSWVQFDHRRRKVMNRMALGIAEWVYPYGMQSDAHGMFQRLLAFRFSPYFGSDEVAPNHKGPEFETAPAIPDSWVLTNKKPSGKPDFLVADTYTKKYMAQAEKDAEAAAELKAETKKKWSTSSVSSTTNKYTLLPASSPTWVYATDVVAPGPMPEGQTVPNQPVAYVMHDDGSVSFKEAVTAETLKASSYIIDDLAADVAALASDMKGLSALINEGETS